MAGEIELVAKLKAFEAGRAQLIASNLRVAIRDDAMILAPIAMAGEDTTIHAVAVGHVGEEPEVQVVPDPRNRDAQYWLFRWLGRKIERYFTRQRKAGEYPQIWVSSGVVAQLLDVLSDRFRFNRQDKMVQRFGALLAYATERVPIAGQQVIHTATGSLTQHFATGQHASDDEHLGALLAWIEPPVDMAILEAVEAAEKHPMGAKTLPDFDRKVLEPLLKDYNKARKAGAHKSALLKKARKIHEALEPIAIAIYENIQRSIEILQKLSLVPIPDIEEFENQERYEFLNFMDSRDQGYPIPVRDKPKAATHKISNRERMQEIYDSALIHGDAVIRAHAMMDGYIVECNVEKSTTIKIGKSKREHRLVVKSDQDVMRVRPGDVLCSLEDSRLSFVVESTRKGFLELRVASGMIAVGVPKAGDKLVLGPSGPDWNRLISQRKQTKERLKNQSWTHTDDPIPEAQKNKNQPQNLIERVEALR